MKPKSKILIIAGSDSSGGAGIQADIKTVTALGSYAMTAITAITAQNTKGVYDIHSIPLKSLEKQIMVTCNDIKPDAIKIGMLHSSEVINIVEKCLSKIKIKKVVLDPVMIAKGGARLIGKPAIKDLKKIIKKSLIITPNIPEAEVLTNIKINNTEDMILASTRLLNLGAKNILLKGGHLNSKILRDLFFNNKEYKVFSNKKINTNNTHGTGCTLSSAVATFLSCGKPVNKSCELAIKYVNQSLKSKINYGKGHGPVNHLNSITLESKFK